MPHMNQTTKAVKKNNKEIKTQFLISEIQRDSLNYLTGETTMREMPVISIISEDCYLRLAQVVKSVNPPKEVMDLTRAKR